MKLPAGKYWIGDPCYVFADKDDRTFFDWQEFCNFCFDHDSSGRNNEGVVIHQGIRFAFHGTAYGDGGYTDQYGNRYGVDAGLIGCIPYSVIQGKFSDKELKRLGAIHTFEEEFESSYKDGLITFGHVEIYTGDQDEGENGYEYEDEEDEEDEEEWEDED